MTQYVFKIRNKKTGQFSNGGWTPKFSSTGNHWTSMGMINAFINNVPKAYLEQHYKDCEIVAYEVKEKSTLSIEAILKRKKLYEELGKLHNDSSLPGLIEKLYFDTDDEISEFRWLLYVKPAGQPESMSVTHKRFSETAKHLNIKRSDYRVSGRCVIFKSEQQAAMFRLAIGLECFVYDAYSLAEVNV